MAKGNDNMITESTERQLPINAESLLNHSRQELIELAKNLLNGKYKNDSHQRNKIMQLLVKQLSPLEASK